MVILVFIHLIRQANMQKNSFMMISVNFYNVIKFYYVDI